MPTPKSWIAEDVRMLQLRLEKIGSDIIVHRDFIFVDNQSQSISELGLHMFQTTVKVADVPQNILSALQAIDSWIYNQILIQEGME